MKHFILIAFAFVSALCGGCVSNYTQSYRAMPGAAPEAAARLRAAPPPATPRIERSPAFPESEPYEQRGYTMLGYSSFISSHASESDAVEQGQKIGADLVVLVDPSYKGSTTASVPVTTPTTSTSYTKERVTTHGPAGPVSTNINSKTTTQGTQTTYTPVIIDRYQYDAVYFIQRKHYLGTIHRNLNDQERAAIQSNKGAVVHLIVNDTPAFRSDILVGDIITKVNDQLVQDSVFLSEMLSNLEGQEITLTILRNKKTIKKKVLLNQY